MVKKSKDEALDLSYFNSGKKQDTKEKKFNFDEEIIIGLRRIDNEEDKPKIKNNKNQLKPNKSKVKRQSKPNGVQKEKKLTPKQELARKKRKAIFRMTKYIIILAMIIGAGIYALLSPIFNIKNISVLGNTKISADEIISLSEVQLEQNMFQYQKSDIIKNIKKNAYIDMVKINRKIPDKIEIVVTERKPSFLLQFANAYAYISNQGYILEISTKKLELPILIGCETEQENIQAGYRLCTEDLQKLGDVLKIIEAATSNKLAKFITSIDVTDNENYILTLKEKKKVVYLGDTSNLSTKMLWILKVNEEEGNVQGDIILNMNLNDERNKPRFRKKV